VGVSAFHKSLWPEIIRRYETGEEMKAIAEDLGIDQKTVYNVTRRAGLPRRHVFDQERRDRIIAAYKAGVPPTQIAEREGVTRNYVRDLARKAGLPPRKDWARKYTIDETAFDEPTSVGWWLIGLLAADGHIGVRDNLVALTQTERDIDVLHAFLAYLDCHARPLIELRLSADAASRSHPHQRAFEARVQSKYLCTTLAQYCITPRKTKSLVLSDTAAEEPAVWLGILDGDGWVSRCGQRGRPYRHKGELHGMKLYGANAIRAARLLLGSSAVSLQRKRRTLAEIAALKL
jgi:hypothetical protein